MSSWGKVILAAAVLAVASNGPGIHEAAAKDEIPSRATLFPADKTGTVRGRGARYYIDGKTVIPRTANIRVEQGVTIIGINGASLDVRGGLRMHGTQDTWITIHNVDFSTTTLPRKGLHMDMVDFRKCRFKHGRADELRGRITIENSCFQRDCEFDIRFKGGFLKIMTVEFGMPCRIRCDRQKENSVPIELEVRSSWMKRIELIGPGMANFRHSEIKGGLFCTNVTEVTVDGCDITNEIVFDQRPEDVFKKIKLTKCNLFDGCKLVLRREAGAKTKKERIKLDKFYFGPRRGGRPVTKKKEVADLIEDGADASDGNIKATWNKPKKRKHVLVNYDTLRDRAPDLR